MNDPTKAPTAAAARTLSHLRGGGHRVVHIRGNMEGTEEDTKCGRWFPIWEDGTDGPTNQRRWVESYADYKVEPYPACAYCAHAGREPEWDPVPGDVFRKREFTIVVLALGPEDPERSWERMITVARASVAGAYVYSDKLAAFRDDMRAAVVLHKQIPTAGGQR